MSDQYQWWRDALAGKKPDLDVNTPQPGFYKLRDGKGGPWEPVAIWHDEQSELLCRVGAGTRNPHDIWQWCAGNPVKQADAKHAFQNGTWPGDVPDIPAVGHNAPPEAVEDQIDDVAAQAASWLSDHGIVDETSSNMAANYRQQLLDLRKKADKNRVDEKRPFDEAAKAVQAKWKPVLEIADNAANALRDALTKWMRAEEARLRTEAAEKARQERQEQEAALARKEAENRGDPEPVIEEPPLPIEPPPTPKVQAGGQRGRKTGLRTVKRAVVTDYEKALAHFAQHDKVTALIEQLAQHAARDGHPVPGVEVIEEKVAA